VRLQRKYDKRSNPFHNYNHGVSVMQSCHFMVSTRAVRQLLSELSRFSLIVSGLCHDVNHTGRSNAFEISSRGKLAVLYHDKSVPLPTPISAPGTTSCGPGHVHPTATRV
jgi:cAMP-specific phosphodiesterase 4